MKKTLKIHRLFAFSRAAGIDFMIEILHVFGRAAMRNHRKIQLYVDVGLSRGFYRKQKEICKAPCFEAGKGVKPCKIQHFAKNVETALYFDFFVSRRGIYGVVCCEDAQTAVFYMVLARLPGRKRVCRGPLVVRRWWG